MLTQHDGKLETFPFRGTLVINKKSSREQLLHKNNKNGSLPKYFNKNTDTSNTDPTQDTIDCNWPKVNSVRFEYLYDHINPMENTHDDTHLLDTHVEHNREDSNEEELFEEKN